MQAAGCNTRRTMDEPSGIAVTSAINFKSSGTRTSNLMGIRVCLSIIAMAFASAVSATYLIGPRGPEYKRDAAGNVKWNSYDGLGSMLGEVDANGNLTATKSYDVFGVVRTSAGTSTTSHPTGIE